MRKVFSHLEPDRFVSGTIGEPGERVFFLQVKSGNNVTSVIVEKSQVAILSERIDTLLNQIMGENIEPYIEVAEVLSPVSIESKTASYMGSLYGTSSNSKMAAFMRHPNDSKTSNGLYFVGGSVHPGGGIPLCLSSANIVANLIKDKYHA